MSDNGFLFWMSMVGIATILLLWLLGRGGDDGGIAI